MAAITVHATFDGAALRLDEPLDLPPNSRVRLTIEVVERVDAPERRASFLETARSLNLQGPPDWSSRLGH
jgi:hypothetical protein